MVANLEDLLKLYNVVLRSSTNGNSRLINDVTKHICYMMQEEIKSNLGELKGESTCILEIFVSELTIKIQSLDINKNKILISNNLTYSKLASDILKVHVEKLYILFLKHISLCLQALNKKCDVFMGYSEFKSSIGDFFYNLNIAMSEEDYNKKYDSFINQFRYIINIYIENNDILLPYKKGMQLVKDVKDIANIVMYSFKTIVDFTIENKDNIVTFEEEYKIISAINETLLIKIENINEDLRSFLKEVESVELNLNETSDIGELVELLNNVKDINLNSLKKILSNINNTQFVNEVIKKVSKSSDILNKKIISYKKTSLLFEITTFNELLNYSIFRLKKCSDIDILMYIQMVEEANSMINTTLTKYSIRTIEPKEHTLFNGKEHEVIMTESKQGFKKGEIIKVTNYGYKLNETIIIRANVVVAR